MTKITIKSNLAKSFSLSKSRLINTPISGAYKTWGGNSQKFTHSGGPKMGGASTGRLQVANKKVKRKATPGPAQYRLVSTDLIKKRSPSSSMGTAARFRF